MKNITGTRFGDEDIHCKIGEGQYGTVFLMNDGYDFFALKVTNITNKQLAVQNYIKVKDIVKDIKSNFIVQFSDVADNNCDYYEKEKPFLVFDFIPGCTLHEYLEILRDKRCEIRKSLKYQIISGILRGIVEVHDKGLMHRDIKPGNIFLDQDFHPHLGDFDDLSQSGSTFNIHGTINFSPPEITMIPKINSPGFDIYQFGGTLFQILTKEWPFNNLDIKQDALLDEIGKGKTDDRVEKGEIIIKDEDKPLYEIVKRCWVKDYKERPSAETLFNEVYELAQQNLTTEEFDEYYNYLCASAGPVQKIGTFDNVKRAIENGFADVIVNQDKENTLAVIAHKCNLPVIPIDHLLEVSSFPDEGSSPFERSDYDYTLYSMDYTK